MRSAPSNLSNLYSISRLLLPKVPKTPSQSKKTKSTVTPTYIAAKSKAIKGWILNFEVLKTIHRMATKLYRSIHMI